MTQGSKNISSSCEFHVTNTFHTNGGVYQRSEIFKIELNDSAILSHQYSSTMAHRFLPESLVFSVDSTFLLQQLASTNLLTSSFVLDSSFTNSQNFHQRRANTASALWNQRGLTFNIRDHFQQPVLASFTPLIALDQTRMEHKVDVEMRSLEDNAMDSVEGESRDYSTDK